MSGEARLLTKLSKLSAELEAMKRDGLSFVQGPVDPKWFDRLKAAARREEADLRPSSPPRPATESEKPTVPVAPSLENVAARVAACSACGLAATRTSVVPGEGNPKARLMFVGEAPGAEEDKQGRPFVGRAGQLLADMIKAMGLSRDEVFIANVLKCRPPGNRDPLPDEIDLCESFLLEQIALVRPEYICALGRIAAQALLKTKTPIGQLRGTFHDYHGVPLLATYHPAYLLRSPGEKKEAWKDLQMIMKKMGLELPGERK